MNTQLKASMEVAISNVIAKHCEDDYWDYLIHPQVVKQMANAVEAVFDAAQDAQEYYEHETQ
jgi:hypothetical protein